MALCSSKVSISTNKLTDMIIEYKNGERIVSNNSLADKIADAQYYLGVAMASGNSRNKKKWMRELKRLEALAFPDNN